MEFPPLSDAMFDFETGVSNFEQFKISITAACLALNPKRIKAVSDLFAENMFRLTELLSFPYAISGNRADLTVCLSKNLIPVVGKIRGYTFCHLPSGEIDCDLTAEQYIDAVSLLQAYSAAPMDSTLERLAEVLYPGISKAKPQTLHAIYYNFRGILQYLKRLPKYELIFTEPVGQRRGANPVGMSSTIYQLAKAGYGDIDLIRKLNIFAYLDILLQQTIETIHVYQGSKMKPGEIADKLNLPVEIILPYITTDYAD